jgi:hypothetical protein
MKRTFITAIIVAGLLGGTALAQEQGARPAPDAGSRTATVVSTKGPAEYAVINGQDEPEWKKLQADLALPAGSVIRTGFRAHVVLKLPDGTTVEIRRATKIGISQLGRDEAQGAGKTRIGLKYGTIRAKVEKQQAAGDVEVATPVATLSVAGSEAEIGYAVDTCLGVQTQAGAWNVARCPCRNIVVPAGDETDCALLPGVMLKMYRRDSYMAGPLGLTAIDKRVDLLRGTGRGWVGLPGSPWTAGENQNGKRQLSPNTEELELRSPP